MAKGDYELLIDGKNVGTYSADALAAGVNLADNKNTPQYAQSAEVFKAVEAYRSICGSLREINARINELLRQSIKSEGVVNLFSDVKEEFSIFDPKFLAEVAKLKQKNLVVELLKKLIAEQVSIYQRTNVVKSQKFSELLQKTMRSYLNGLLTNEEVIQELLKMAKEIVKAKEDGNALGLTTEESAFYDALTKPQAVKDFYSNEQLVAITKELTEALRKNKTIDWQHKETARARMRMLIRRLLKKYKYPPEGQEEALNTVIAQCEMWTDNTDLSAPKS